MSRRLWAAVALSVAAVALGASAANAAGETVGSCMLEDLVADIVVSDVDIAVSGVDGEDLEAVKNMLAKYLDSEGLEAVENLMAAYEDGDKKAKELKEGFEDDLEDCFEAPNPIIPEITEIIYGGAAFLVLLVLMKWKLFPTVKGLMEQRTQRIQDSLDDADRIKAEAAEVKARYEAELADARTEAARIVDEAREQAAAVRSDLQARAEADIAEMRERAAADAEASKRQAIADLQSEVSDIALGAAEAVLGRNLENPETQRQLVDDYIARVGANQ